MTDPTAEIRDELRSYLLREHLPGENASRLTDDTPLLSGGILDSISVLQYVAFLENRYKIELKAHELTRGRIDTIAAAAGFIRAKIAEKK